MSGKYKDKLEQSGIRVVSPVRDGVLFRVLHFFSACKLVWKIRAVIIQGWMYQGNLLALALWFFTPRPSRLFWNVRHGLDDLQGERFVTLQTIRLCSFFSRAPYGTIYNSNQAKRQHREFGFQDRNSLVIPNGFTLQDPAKGLADSLRKKIAVESDIVLIGHVGRFHEVKDHRTFVKAMCLRWSGVKRHMPF